MLTANWAKVSATGINPCSEKPAAALIMLASATPMSKELSGKRFRKAAAPVEPGRSALMEIKGRPFCFCSVRAREIPSWTFLSGGDFFWLLSGRAGF